MKWQPCVCLARIIKNRGCILKNLANTNPQLQGLDLDNLEGTARSLCEKNNIDMNQLAEQIKGFANSHK